MTTNHIRALCDYIDASPTAFHAVDSAMALLKAHGGIRLYEADSWRLDPGTLYFVVRDDAALIAFRTGTKAPAEAGFAIAGAHTDAPGLRARIEKSVASRGMERVAVEVYGGPIHSSWLDRPLSLAGRVVTRSADGSLRVGLVNFARPVAQIPNLAIHFNREVNKGVEFPVHTALLPLVAAKGSPGKTGSAGLTDSAGSAGSGGAAVSTGSGATGSSWVLRALATELGVSESDILSAELTFIDAAKSFVYGEQGEILSAPRIDNLAGCHAILTAFCAAGPAAHGQMAVLFDNEEIGSGTSRGAASSLLSTILSRICIASPGKITGTDGVPASADSGMPAGTYQTPLNQAEDAYRALARSFQVSVDGAQAWHPGYADKFDEDFAPVLNGGPTVKANANVRYATEAIGEAMFKAWCAQAGVPCQRFRMRADLAPGSTIGPVSSALLGVRTVDVGVPMLAMHAAREIAGAADHDMMIAALGAFYASGPRVPTI
jgi:aspartyl aminopeptidase